MGDVVAVYSEALGEWTASQIIEIDEADNSAAVLELDWSGPEPASVDELADVQPLRRAFGSWDDTLVYANQNWVLPRSFKVIGSMPPLVSESPFAFAWYWGRGEALAAQRRWDSGDRGDWSDRHELTCTADELTADAAITDLTVSGIGELDCGRLVTDFPRLKRLALSGNPGTLTSADALNRLPRLQALWINDLFGMQASDCLLPGHVPALEELTLYNIPAEYATAMRKAWRLEVRHGVLLNIRGARKPDWVAANANNPLRDWDGREHIPRGGYRKAVAAYGAARAAVLGEAPDYAEIGRAFAAALNALAFVETVERDELFDALDALLDEAQAAAADRETLIAAVDAVRDW